MKKIFLVLTALFLTLVLVGCGATPTTKANSTTTKKVVTTTTKSGGDATTTNGGGASTTTTQSAADQVEAFDYGGKTIRIATHRAADFDYNYSSPLDPTKIRNNDDNTEYWDVVERTTKYIEKKYNCKFEWIDLTTISESNTWTHYQNVYASNDMYDIIEDDGEVFSYLYANDMLQELPEDYLSDAAASLLWGGADGYQYNAFKHLDKKWGIGSTNTIYDVDATLKANAFTPILYYNLDILKDAGIEKMPSEYWEEGTWTWDVFETMCLQVVNNLPGVQGFIDHAYAGGIQNFLGANGTFVFDDYGNMGFYSEAAQAVYTKWQSWTDSHVLYNYTWSGTGAPDSYWDRRWFPSGASAFAVGYFSDINTYWKDLNVSCVPYPAGPNAQNSDGTINMDKYNFNWYACGYFWSVPKNKDLRLYQILAEFYGGLKEYYTNADDLDATIEDFVYERFPFDECEYVIDLFKYIQENMNFFIIQSAVPSGIFRQAIREHYNKSSAFYGEMWNYMVSRRSELDPDNPNNFWKCIFGEPGNVAQS